MIQRAVLELLRKRFGVRAKEIDNIFLSPQPQTTYRISGSWFLIYRYNLWIVFRDDHLTLYHYSFSAVDRNHILDYGAIHYADTDMIPKLFADIRYIRRNSAELDIYQIYLAAVIISLLSTLSTLSWLIIIAIISLLV